MDRDTALHEVNTLTERNARCRGARRGAARGFTIIEVTLALIVFLLMTLMFAAVFPMAVRAAQSSNLYAQAALVARHKLDQLRSAGKNNLTGTSASVAASLITSLNIADAQNADGSYDFTSADNLTGASGYFPAGATGTFVITDASQMAAQIPAMTTTPASGHVVYVTVKVRWTGLSGVPSQYQTSTFITQ